MSGIAVIFDCDGVLVDSEPLSNRVLSDVLTEHGVAMSPLECRETFVGLNPRGVASKLLATRGLDLTIPLTTLAVPRFMADLRRIGLPPIPGVRELLSELKARGTPIAVASNSPLEELRLKLELAGLTKDFDPHIHSGDALGRSKPDPGVYLHAAEILRVNPAACTVVEDTPTGVTAGVRAGMRVLGFAGTHPASADSLRVAGASDVFFGMAELTSCLTK